MIEGQLSQRKVLTLGADPEMFVFSGVNKLLPAFKFLRSKASGDTMYWDGFQAEWKYNHEGNYCLNNLVKHTRENLIKLRSLAQRFDKNARLSLTNVVRVSNGFLTDSEMQHIELGCMPSYNAYGLRGEHVLDPRKLKFRFAGGHMHFGSWTRRPLYERIVQTCDNILGVWSVGAARHMDNPVRRQYYGLPGEYRKPRYGEFYGVEYRTLSNFWLASPSLMQLTWDLGRMCVRMAHSRKYLDLWVADQDETIDVIKNCDYDRATRILDRNQPMLRWMLSHVYRRKEAIDMALQVARQGLEIVVPNPEAIPQNWHFADVWMPDAALPWARWETSVAK